MVALGAILATTLQPDVGMPDPGTGPGICVLVRAWPASLPELTTISEASLNVFLFVPLGVALGLLARSRVKTCAVIAAFVLPFAIEAVQYVLPALGRYCDSADVADNVTGLAIGLVVGTIAGGATTRLNRGRRASADRGSEPR